MFFIGERTLPIVSSYCILCSKMLETVFVHEYHERHHPWDCNGRGGSAPQYVMRGTGTKAFRRSIVSRQGSKGCHPSAGRFLFSLTWWVQALWISHPLSYPETFHAFQLHHLTILCHFNPPSKFSYVKGRTWATVQNASQGSFCTKRRSWDHLLVFAFIL